MPDPPLPEWRTASPHCIACGYSLNGLAASGACPECGRAYDGSVMILAGMVRDPSKTLSGLITQRAIRRLVFSPGGYGFASESDPPVSKDLRTWSDIDGFDCTLISATWHLLQLRAAEHPATHQTKHALRSIVFEAGIHCRQEDLARIKQTLARYLRDRVES